MDGMGTVKRPACGYMHVGFEETDVPGV
jgi:hypothetical protein